MTFSGKYVVFYFLFRRYDGETTCRTLDGNNSTNNFLVFTLIVFVLFKILVGGWEFL